jgi:hypothetical protein
MANRRITHPPAFIAFLGKAMNGVMLLVCSSAAGWAARLFYARQRLPYNTAGLYFNPQTGITYDEKIVRLALGLFVLFAILTVLLLVSAYKLYVATPRRKPGNSPSF